MQVGFAWQSAAGWIAALVGSYLVGELARESPPTCGSGCARMPRWSWKPGSWSGPAWFLRPLAERLALLNRMGIYHGNAGLLVTGAYAASIVLLGFGALAGWLRRGGGLATDFWAFMDSTSEPLASVFQDFVRYSLAAGENIGVGEAASLGDRTRIETAAAGSGAAPVIAGLPRGYDTVLGKKWAGGEELSGGQWQKVAIARLVSVSLFYAKELHPPASNQHVHARKRKLDPACRFRGISFVALVEARNMGRREPNAIHDDCQGHKGLRGRRDAEPGTH